MTSILQNLCKAFMENNASLAEINPLVLTAKGTLTAIDAKMVFDVTLFTATPIYMLFSNLHRRNNSKLQPKKEDSAMYVWTETSVAW